MKNLFLLLFVFPFVLSAQDFGKYIEKHAIKIDSLYSLNSDVYEKIKDFDLIMVGEMHGTMEPAQLVFGLANISVKNEGTVSVGIEIPRDEMATYLRNPSDSNVLESRFFSKPNNDGRNGEAWAQLIRNCQANSQIHVFFFDNVGEQQVSNRDSAMYLSLVEQKLKFPSDKIITLSGNIHNRTIPYKEIVTMGTYCMNDSVNFNQTKICSIAHQFSEGTMLNNKGNGLETTTIEFQESVYSKSVPFSKYLLFFPMTDDYPNNCIFYTRKVNQSNEIHQ